MAWVGFIVKVTIIARGPGWLHLAFPLLSIDMLYSSDASRCYIHMHLIYSYYSLSSLRTYTHSHSLDRSCSCVFLPSRTLVCRLLKLLVSKCHHARSSLSPSAHVVSSQTANRRSSLDRSFNTTFLIGLDYISLCIRTGVHEEVVNSLNIPSRVHRKQVDYNNTRHIFQESI